MKSKTAIAFGLAALGFVGCDGVLCAQTVNVWLTTDNRSKLLQQQSPVFFAIGNAGTNCVVVDESKPYQQIEGFGAAFTDTTGYVLNQLASPVSRTNALRALFTRDAGAIGLSFMRIPMGGSDLARFHYSYDDLPTGQTDTNLALFSIAHDQVDIIPLIQQARVLNPQLKLMASPWSPPGWMKTSGSMIGGSLLPTMHRPFANYFVRFIQAYQAHGIPIDYLSLQNEPLYVPGDYPGLDMNAATQLSVLRDYLLPALSSNQLPAKVLVYDHNWDRPDYPDTVLSDPTVLASSQVAGTAWHGYGGTPGVMISLAKKFPAKGNYQTEHSGGDWVQNQVRTDFTEIIHVMRSWGKCFVKWNLAGDQNDGPHAGGCGTCTPLVIVNSSSGSASYSIDYYTLGHFSKFILPGAYRVYSGNADGIVTAAFVNPDGSKVLVAFNDTSANSTFQIQWGNRVMAYTLPAFSGATFTWVGSQTGAYAHSATNRIWASSFNSVTGLQTEPSTDIQGGYNLGYAESGDYAVYENVNFGSGIASVFARVASAGSGGTLEFRLDNLTGPLIASLGVPVTGGWQTWQTVTGSAAAASGLHNLFVIFKGGSGIGNLNWIQFGSALPPLPVPWTSGDVGSVGLIGAAVFSDAKFTVSGSGGDIWNDADAFQFVRQPVSAACEVRARVVSLSNTDPWAKAGVMLREDATTGAVNATMVVTAGNGVAFQVRANAGGVSTSAVIGGLAAPRWVRIVRSAGNSVSGYYSLDGTNWTQAGTSVSLPLSTNALAGLAVTAHNNTAACAAIFESVSVNQPPRLAAIPAQAVMAGRTLVITNTATDPDVPPQGLSFRFLNSPPGATMHTNTGLITWRPAIASAPTAQPFTIVVSDGGLPSMSATQSFYVSVSRPVAPVLGSPAISNGYGGFWIQGDVGPDYTIEVSTNLVTWSQVATATPSYMPWYWIDTNAAVLSPRFYRALLGP